MLTRRDFSSLALASAATPLVGSMPQAQPAKPKRLIVDAQVHIWKANTPDRPWVQGAQAQLPEPMTVERLVPIMDEGGVDKVIIVPPSLEGTRFDYGQEAARRYPGRFATMGRVNLNDPAEKDRVPKMREQAHLLGARFFFQPSAAKWLTDGTADWFWPMAEKIELPVMFLSIGQTPLFAKIAEQHPRLPLIIDHLGVTIESVKEGVVAQRIAETVALAKYPNVSVKLSSTPLYSKQSYPWRDMDDHIKRVFDAYGPRRCHWGTDITNCFDQGPMSLRVKHFTEELKFLSEDDKDWVMGKSILEKLRWA
jgi:predicted TIM-barrel fold metal-dependent hydrolase